MSAVLQRMNVDAFLAWTESQEDRYELEDGAVVAMAPERLIHARTKFEAAKVLDRAVGALAGRCRTYIEGPGVQIEDGTIFIPDVVVQCGEQPDDHARLADAPTIVVEVLSPSTSQRDTQVKPPGYLRLPSLHHYLIVDPERRIVVHHRRAPAGIATCTCSDGMLELDPPGIVVPVADLFPT